MFELSQLKQTVEQWTSADKAQHIQTLLVHTVTKQRCNNLLTSFRFRHRQMCKLILQLNIRVMCNSTAITCACVSHTCTRQWVMGFKNCVYFCWYKSFQHSCSLPLYLSSDKPSQISLQPSCGLAALTAWPPLKPLTFVLECDSMCLPLCLRECASVQNAWEQMWVWENVLVWVTVWLCVIMGVTSTY